MWKWKVHKQHNINLQGFLFDVHLFKMKFLLSLLGFSLYERERRFVFEILGTNRVLSDTRNGEVIKFLSAFHNSLWSNNILKDQLRIGERLVSFPYLCICVVGCNFTKDYFFTLHSMLWRICLSLYYILARVCAHCV